MFGVFFRIETRTRFNDLFQKVFFPDFTISDIFFLLFLINFLVPNFEIIKGKVLNAY